MKRYIVPILVWVVSGLCGYSADLVTGDIFQVWLGFASFIFGVAGFGYLLLAGPP